MSTAAKSTLWILKALGLVIMTAAFFIRNADQYPWLLELTCPKYLAAQQGVETIRARKLLTNDLGFRELADAYVEFAASKDAKIRDYGPVITSMRLGGGTESGHKIINRQIVIEGYWAHPNKLSNSLPEIDFDFLLDVVTKMKNEGLLAAALRLFIGGLIVEIVALVVDAVAHFKEKSQIGRQKPIMSKISAG